MTKLTFEVLMDAVQNKVLDFGPPLAAREICPAWTVERLSLWEHTTLDKFEMVAVRASYMAKARAQGTLYNMTDEEVYQLDRERGHGVHCDRKLLPIMVMVKGPNPTNAMLPAVETFVRAMAYVYIGRNEHWVYTIREGSRKAAEPEMFKAPDRYPHPNPLINGSFCFLPPPSDYGRVYTADPRVLRKVKRKNHQFGRNLWFTKMRWFLTHDDGEQLIPNQSSQDIKGRIP